MTFCFKQGFYSCRKIISTKQLGRKGFIRLTLPHCCSSMKEIRTGTKAGKKAGADAETMERCSLLACFPWLAQLVLHDYQIRDGPIQRGPFSLDH